MTKIPPPEYGRKHTDGSRSGGQPVPPEAATLTDVQNRLLDFLLKAVPELGFPFAAWRNLRDPLFKKGLRMLEADMLTGICRTTDAPYIAVAHETHRAALDLFVDSEWEHGKWTAVLAAMPYAIPAIMISVGEAAHYCTLIPHRLLLDRAAVLAGGASADKSMPYMPPIAETAPEETDAELLQRLGSDAGLWAAEMLRRCQLLDMDEADLTGWFANAIEAGRLEGYDIAIDHNRARREDEPAGCGERQTEVMIVNPDGIAFYAKLRPSMAAALAEHLLIHARAGGAVQ